MYRDTALSSYSDKAYQLMHKGVLALARAEQQGLRVDTDYITRKKEEISQTVINLERAFRGTAFYKEWKKSTKTTLNIYSPQQLSTFLYKVKGYKIEKATTSGQGSTDEDSLSQLNIPEINTLLKIKKLKKIRDTYLDSFEREQVDGFLHPFYNLHLVRTFRSSSDSPNFQNIPKRDKEAMYICRKALFPRKGHQLLELDYKQLEVRIAYCYNKDPKLKYDILHGDMHLDMAKEIYFIKDFDKENPAHSTLRSAAKNGFVFPEFYGDFYKNCALSLACQWGQLPNMGTWKSGQGIKMGTSYLSDHLIKNKIRNLDQFTEHIKAIEYQFWKVRYKTYNAWKNEWWESYQKNGYARSLTGFTFQGVMSRNDVINYPVQGAAFHCLLWSLIEGTRGFLISTFKANKFKTRIIGQIHDAIVLDVYPPELEQVVKIMKCIMCNDIVKAFPWITVDLDVDAELCPVDGSWADKQRYDISGL